MNQQTKFILLIVVILKLQGLIRSIKNKRIMFRMRKVIFKNTKSSLDLKSKIAYIKQFRIVLDLKRINSNPYD